MSAITLSLIGYIVFKPKWREYQRKKIKSQPFPKSWRSILRKNVPYFYRMPAHLQLQLKQHILVFLAEKRFYGFEGIEINDEIRVTIASQACLLLLNRKTDYYPKLQSIYVYPAAFITNHQGVDAAGVLQSQHRVLSGESWELGKVILSWKDAHEGAKDYLDGQNVVIHEFAHQLDQETGAANGAPFLRHNNRDCWSKVLSDEFEKLRQQALKQEDSLLDHYGATNPAEFFAVASEVFFEQPQLMFSRHPQLYNQLKGFYQVSPSDWQ
ncbi:zinc-dependent peptidase [Aliikangiella coralliicola]|uniref:Zinc-dependent peptidase n=1 Tax=Aliikangiella coralliicola TaxID=2592383 RepID=A0A545U565_9GAMM|nr:zinc-dependent peptidase [Aliikangiella coralliicola]